jgi:HEAT repeat protein
MLDATGKKILRLVRADQPIELRRAAVQVLAEVGARDTDVSRVLRELFADPDAALRLEALRAVGKLRIEQALPELLQRITEGGPESEAAAHAAAHLGPKGARGLRDLMGHVAPGLRRRIAGVAHRGRHGRCRDRRARCSARQRPRRGGRRRPVPRR